MKKKYVLICFGISILLLCCIIVLVTRFSNHTTYTPFSGKLFCLESSEIECIQITSGSGEHIQIKEAQEIETIVNFLNGMRYEYCYPILDIAKGGYPYMIQIKTKEDILLCEFASDWIVYRNVRYCYSPEKGFETLIELLKEN